MKKIALSAVAIGLAWGCSIAWAASPDESGSRMASQMYGESERAAPVAEGRTRNAAPHLVQELQVGADSTAPTYAFPAAWPLGQWPKDDGVWAYQEWLESIWTQP